MAGLEDVHLVDGEPAPPPPVRTPRPAGTSMVRPHHPDPRRDRSLETMWAVHPTAIYDRRNRAGPWFQFRVPYGFEWNRVEVPVPNLPRPLEGLRILHVCDFHCY